MAFPSNTGTTQDNLAESWERARRLAGQLKSLTNNLNSAAAAGLATGHSIVNYCEQITNIYESFQVIAATPGIAAYAQQQISNSSMDVASAFDAMSAAILGAVSWIEANFPKDADGYLLYVTLVSGKAQFRVFSAADTSSLRTILNGLLNTID